MPTRAVSKFFFTSQPEEDDARASEFAIVKDFFARPQRFVSPRLLEY